MNQMLETILQFGKFAMGVVAVCVVVIVLFSIMDRHPRDKNPGDDDHRS